MITFKLGCLLRPAKISSSQNTRISPLLLTMSRTGEASKTSYLTTLKKSASGLILKETNTTSQSRPAPRRRSISHRFLATCNSKWPLTNSSHSLQANLASISQAHRIWTRKATALRRSVTMSLSLSLILDQRTWKLLRSRSVWVGSTQTAQRISKTWNESSENERESRLTS